MSLSSFSFNNIFFVSLYTYDIVVDQCHQYHTSIIRSWGDDTTNKLTFPLTPWGHMQKGREKVFKLVPKTLQKIYLT